MEKESESEFPCGASYEDLLASLACKDGLRQVYCPKCKKLHLILLGQVDEQCDQCRKKDR